MSEKTASQKKKEAIKEDQAELEKASSKKKPESS